MSVPWDELRKISPVQALLGCEWGMATFGDRVMATPDDQVVCTDQASKIIVLYLCEEQIPVRVCPRHASSLFELTTPHEEPADG